MAAELEIRESPRYLAGTLGDLEITLYRDGTATDPDSAGTVTVVDEDGNTLSSGAATVVGGGSGQLRYTPTAAAVASPNRLTITWADIVFGAEPAITVTSKAEVVGDMLFTEAQARAFDNSALSDASTYTDDDIRRGHDRIMDAFQDILGYPLGTRYYRETLSGKGTEKLRLSHPHISSLRKIQKRTSGTTTWTDFTAAELADVLYTNWGLIERETLGVFTEGRQNIRVSYEAGKAINGELRRAGLVLLRYQLVPSSLPDRALFQTSELGQFRLAVADSRRGHWYGLPEVDSVLWEHQETSLW